MVSCKDCKTALFWDESFLWGVMAHQALGVIGLPFDLLTAGDVIQGRLNDYRVFFVPGGWAGDKSRALGKKGREAVQDFVREGGCFVGFCGGAGLALDVEEGLSLAPVRRMPTAERVPNFSGKIQITPSHHGHPLWEGMPEPISLYAWWPGQFRIDPQKGDQIHVLGRYHKPGDDFFVADLKVEDLETAGQDWSEWEALYGIYLDPERLEGEPAILEASYGRGNVFLSYLHLDTPDDPEGLLALRNLFAQWVPQDEGIPGVAPPVVNEGKERGVVHQNVLDLLDRLQAQAEALIALGQRNYLWFWRKPYMLQWRRGIRGMEYGIMLMMIRELRKGFYRVRSSNGRLIMDEEMDLDGELKKVRVLSEHFFCDAERLLLLERFSLSRGKILHHLRTNDPEIGKLRETLFSGTKRFGGLFKELLDRLDRLLLMVLRSS